MAAITLLAVIDERLDNSLRLLTARFFRNAAFGVTLIALALGTARLLHNTYVTTVFDAASGVEIVLYFCFAYGIAWWYDYWIDRLIGQQLFLLIDPAAGGECSTAYGYTGPGVTTVPLVGRTVELQGLAGFWRIARIQPMPRHPISKPGPMMTFSPF